MELYMNNNRRIATITLAVGLIVFSTVFLVTGMMMSTVYGAPDFEKHYLTETDAYLDNLVTKCSQETISYLKVDCTNIIEDAWHIDCSMDYDKLDTCKNGKIENFLKSIGRPT